MSQIPELDVNTTCLKNNERRGVSQKLSMNISRIIYLEYEKFTEIISDTTFSLVQEKGSTLFQPLVSGKLTVLTKQNTVKDRDPDLRAQWSSIEPDNEEFGKTSEHAPVFAIFF